MLFWTPPVTDTSSLDQFEAYTWLVIDTMMATMEGHPPQLPFPMSTFIGNEQYICVFTSRQAADTVKTSVGAPFYRILEFTAPYGAHQMLGMWLSMIDDLDASGIMLLQNDGFHWVIPGENLEMWFNVARGKAMHKASEVKLAEFKSTGKWLQYARSL
jgi:hypothetical protein